MSRSSAATQQLVQYQKQLADLQAEQTKSQEQLDQVRSQLQNPNTEIKPLLAEQERLRQERLELVAKAEKDIVKWTERFEVLSNRMIDELRACYKELQPGITAGLVLQGNEQPKKFLFKFDQLSVPKLVPSDGYWIKWGIVMKHVDLDPEATQRGIAARQAEQERRNAIEEARQQRVNQQEQERRNAMVSDRPSAIAQAQQQRANKLPGVPTS